MPAAADPPPTAPIHAVLFDLDGTLIDHFATLYRCYEFALSRLGLPVPAPEVVRRSVGGSMEVTMRKFVGPEQFPAAAQLWREFLREHFLDDVRLMPGARELVTALHRRGLKLGVLTNKIGENSRGICAHLGLAPLLDLVLGADDTPYRKPQREFVAAALERLRASAGETLLVGDSPYDLDAARAGGIRAAFVTTGTHSAEELRAAGAVAETIFPDLFALGAAVFGLAGASR